MNQSLFHDDLKIIMTGEEEHVVISLIFGITDDFTRTISVVTAELGQSKAWVQSYETRRPNQKMPVCDRPVRIC